jgi:DNA primase small subunit
MRVLDSVLREDFNFQHLLFVFSGRRGAHAWVSDEAARKLSDEQRTAVLGFVNVFSGDTSTPFGYGGGAPAGGGGGGGGDKHLASFFRVLNGLTTPLHPALQRAYQQLDGMFERFIVSEAGQGLLAKPENWEKVLAMMPTEGPGAELAGVFRTHWPDAASAAQRWGQLKTTITNLVKKLKEMPKKGREDYAHLRTLEKLLPALVFTFTYPRLDVEVSKHRNHLLKAPFCIHPKTGKICVPMRLASIDDFDPNVVPTCRTLMDEGNRWLRERGGAGGAAASEEDKAALVAATSLKPYVAEFENFIKEIGVSLQRNKRAVLAAKERQGAALGEW